MKITISNVLASDFDKVEVNVSSADDKIYRINPNFDKIEAHSFTIFPEVLEKILSDANLCDCATDVSEFVACIGRHLEIRELSMLLTGAQAELVQEDDKNEHDFIRNVVSNIILSDGAKKRIVKAIDKYGEL